MKEWVEFFNKNKGLYGFNDYNCSLYPSDEICEDDENMCSELDKRYESFKEKNLKGREDEMAFAIAFSWLSDAGDERFEFFTRHHDRYGYDNTNFMDYCRKQFNIRYRLMCEREDYYFGYKVLEMMWNMTDPLYDSNSEGINALFRHDCFCEKYSIYKDEPNCAAVFEETYAKASAVTIKTNDLDSFIATNEKIEKIAEHAVEEIDSLLDNGTVIRVDQPECLFLTVGGSKICIGRIGNEKPTVFELSGLVINVYADSLTSDQAESVFAAVDGSKMAKANAKFKKFFKGGDSSSYSVSWADEGRIKENMQRIAPQWTDCAEKITQLICWSGYKGVYKFERYWKNE